MQKTLTSLKNKISNALIVDRENHIYRCHRSIFTDPALFDFEKNISLKVTGFFLRMKARSRNPVIITP